MGGGRGKNFLQNEGGEWSMHRAILQGATTGDAAQASWQLVLEKQTLILNQVVNMWVYVLMFLYLFCVSKI